jgi:NTE family protein
MDSFNITQDRIARSRLAGDPPDVFIRGWFNGVGMFDFHKAGELIEAGRDAVRRARHDLEYMGLTQPVE